MASSSFLERKLQGLNCMKTSKRMYGSLDSVDSAVSVPKPIKKKKKKQFNIFRGLGKTSNDNNKSEAFSVSYDRIREEEEGVDEGTRLLTESLPVTSKKKYSSILGGEAEKQSKNVRFWGVEAPKEGGTKKNKKKSFLKRTGKMIVRTCRLMSYGTPYMTHMSADFPYNSRYPPDYRYYDFETKQWDYGYSNNYMGTTGLSPSVFF